MDIQRVPLSQIKPAAYNPRRALQPGDHDFEALERSLSRWGLVEPLVWNQRTGNLVGGHQRLAVLKRQKEKHAEVVVVDLDDDDERALNLALNRVQGEWDEDRLREVLGELDQHGYDLDLTGFTEAEVERLLAGDAGEGSAEREAEKNLGALAERFIVPPFTVLDARQGYWRDRKKAWVERGIGNPEGLGRVLNPAGNPRPNWEREYRGGETAWAGADTSVFDPVLAEVVFRWFAPEGAHVLDPFAGEATKGLVAAHLGLQYTGLELRPEQVKANREQAKALRLAPHWVQGDSARLEALLPKGAEYDLVFTSPPYFDLEVYSKRKEDGSALQTFDAFMAWYRGIFAAAVRRLRPDRFVVVKVAAVRDKRTGGYHDLVGETVRCFTDLGLHFWNEAVLVTAVGSLPLRAGRQFAATRKLGKAHQNVLAFFKGDPAHVQAAFPQEIEYGEGEQDAEGDGPGPADAPVPG